MRRARGFTLVELLVSLFVLALLAGLSWRGLDGMMRSRERTEARSDEVLTLQAGLTQWTDDLDAITEFAGTAPIEWNGRVLRLTRRGSLSPADGARVVGWALREGRWRRWESPPVTTRGDLEAAWQQADQWALNPGDQLRRREVAVTPATQWQIFFYRENAWTNPQSSAAQTTSATTGNASTDTTSTVPDGVRLVLELPPGQALAGTLRRDWVRPTLTP